MPAIWNQELVKDVRGSAPPPNQGLSDQAKADGWILARKVALTPMLPVLVGPEGMNVATQEGDYFLAEGWVGFVAVDQAGYPYPIAQEEFDATYERTL